MTIKKNLLVLVFAYIVLAALAYPQSYINRGTETVHESEPILRITGDKSDVLKEKVECEENKHIEIYVTLYSQYNQGIFTINVPKEVAYDEAMVEKIFYETIEMWIKDKNHRYYSYTITKRNTFFSRKTADGRKCVSTEIKVNFLK